ncbi:MAG: phage replisome organizer N-terminal domain-containing protein [Oscillospiraceae bacterium]
MAEVKWIKIVTDIFDDEKILLIETLPEADSIIVIWFKMLCLAGKQNNGGVFLMSERIPYTEKMLASIFRRNENTVILALKTFEEFGMIEIINETYTIPNWGKHQSLDRLEKAKAYDRDFMRGYRQKQKEIACKVDSKVDSKVYSKAYVSTLDKNRVDKIREEKESADEKKPRKPAFLKFGEYQHVKLTQEQYEKLCSDFGQASADDYIKRVDEYCQGNGKHYNDYNLTVRNWIRKDGEKNGNARTSESRDSGSPKKEYGFTV